MKQKLTGIGDVFQNNQMTLKVQKHSLLPIQSKIVKEIYHPKKSHVYFNQGTHFERCPQNTLTKQLMNAF